MMMGYSKNIVYWIFLLMCVVSTIVSRAQTPNFNRDSLSMEYSFLQLDSNHLEFFQDSSVFMGFYQKMDSLLYQGNGKINIYHMGGSHVQAGVLSNATREHLYSIFPGISAERGFLFPMRLAQTNNPRNFSVSYTGLWEGARASVPWHEGRWGMSAAIATTQDHGSKFTVKAFAGDTGVFSFTSVRLYHLMDSSQYCPVLKTTDTAYYFVVDTASQTTEYFFSTPQTEVSFSLERVNTLQTQFVIQGLQFSKNENGIVYHALGVNGASVPSFLRCRDLPSQVALTPPDLVIFGIGINDAYKAEDQFHPDQYEAHYDSLVAILKEANPQCTFVFMSNNDSYYKRRYANPNVFRARKVQRNLAAKYQSGFWDLFVVMGGYNSIRKWEKEKLATSDKIHFTRKGYELQAQLFFEAFMESYYQYQKQAGRATVH